MKAKATVFLLALALMAIAAYFSHAADEATATPGKTLYTCGMHPQVIQDHPGNCPICGMKLTPIPPDSGAGMEGKGHGPAGSAGLAVDAAMRQKMNLRTAIVQAGPLRKTIRTVGTIDYNETALADVTTRVQGLDRKTGRGRHRPVGASRRSVVRSLFAGTLQCGSGIPAGAQGGCHQRRGRGGVARDGGQQT